MPRTNKGRRPRAGSRGLTEGMPPLLEIIALSVSYVMAPLPIGSAPQHTIQVMPKENITLDGLISISRTVASSRGYRMLNGTRLEGTTLQRRMASAI